MLLKITNTAMGCGLLLTCLDPAVMMYYVGGWFLMVIAMKEGAQG